MDEIGIVDMQHRRAGYWIIEMHFLTGVSLEPKGYPFWTFCCSHEHPLLTVRGAGNVRHLEICSDIFNPRSPRPIGCK